MCPYVLLRDSAQTSNVESPNAAVPSFTPDNGNIRSQAAGFVDFLDYTERLMAQPATSAPLLTPTSPPSERRRSSAFEPTTPSTMKERIDLAILRSNAMSVNQDTPSQSNNRFTIARAGCQVGVLTILRPAYRLGEVVTGKIDFVQQDHASDKIPSVTSYGVSLTLETMERIDPSLALRSASSIQRATRKVYAQVTDTTLFARELSFSLEIPTTATPTFETTGVWLSWRIRIEFTTARMPPKTDSPGLGIDSGPASGGHDRVDELLEEVGADDRATTLIAKERLLAETFEVAVPIRVYGGSAASMDGVPTMNLEKGLEV